MTTSIPSNIRGAGAKNGSAKPEVTDLKDPTQVGLIAVYLVQKLGSPTLQEIQRVALEKLGCKIDGRTLGRVLKGASRAGKPIAVNQTRLPEEQGGAVVDVFNMKDVQRWRGAPEYAHINDLLPKLLQDPEALAIKQSFDEQEVGPAEKKAMRGNDIDDYHHFSMVIYTLDPLLGSQIHCPYTDVSRGEPSKKSDDKPEFEGIFVTDYATGDRLLTSDALAGWFVTNGTRYAGLADAKANYVGFSHVRIPKRIRPIQLILPVNNARQGASAPKSYECIPPKQLLRMDFTAPVKGLLSPAQYEKLFHTIGARPRRGLSPARGRRYGRFLVLGFEDRGPVKNGSLEFLFEDLPAEALKALGRTREELPAEPTTEMWRYLETAVERLKSVDLRSKVVTAEASSSVEEDDE